MIAKWSLHCCPLDRDCRRFGAPWRVGVGTPWFFFDVALRPADQFVRVGGKPRWIMFVRRAVGDEGRC